MKFAFPITAATLICALFLSAGASLAGSCCVGFINLEKLVAESTLGRAAAAQFHKDVDERQAKVQILLEKVQKLKTFFESHSGELNDDEKKAKMDEYNKAVGEYQDALNNAETEIKAKNEAAMKDIFKKIDPILEKVAAERGLLIVIKDARVLGYVHPSVDVTSEVLRSLEAQTAAAGKAH
jgi:Skp family chaperone for outer membrane proteins